MLTIFTGFYELALSPVFLIRALFEYAYKESIKK